MPQTSEPVDDAPALVQHGALHLVLVGVWAPVTGLQQNTIQIINIKTLAQRNISKRRALSGTGSGFRHLDEGDLAGADVVLEVADGDLSVMLQVALLTEDVMDAGHHFVPLVVVSVPGQNNKIHVKCECLLDFSCWVLSSDGQVSTVYLGRVTFTIPVGRISSDFPQNLFFHRWSVQE